MDNTDNNQAEQPIEHTVVSRFKTISDVVSDVGSFNVGDVVELEVYS